VKKVKNTILIFKFFFLYIMVEKLGLKSLMEDSLLLFQIPNIIITTGKVFLKLFSDTFHFVVATL
jgi:hypothetical protein